MREESSAEDRPPVLEALGISKRFGATIALSDVSIDLRGGETRAIVGENGAGKTTLIKVIGGTERPDAGTLILQGKHVAWRSPHEARDRGIAVVHQELSLVGDLTVVENLFLRRERLSKVGLIRRRTMVIETQDLFDRLSISGIGPHMTVRQLSPSQKQLVEIAKAVKDSPAVLILDEPTSTLGEVWVEWLFGRLADWRAEGMAIAFISHRIAEVTAIGDAITVLRNGRLVLDVRRGEKSEGELIAAMSGREIDVAFAKISPPRDEPVLTVTGLSGQRWPRNVSFSMKAGEIVGIGGLDGQGQRELLLCLYGISRAHGTVRVDDEKPLHRWSPSRMQDLRVGLMPADRRGEGLLQRNSIGFNMALPWLRSYNRWSFLDSAKLLRTAHEVGTTLALSTNDYSQLVSVLSGGNQQKVVLAKWLLGSPRLLILYDVTRGVDIGTKVQIYHLLAKLASEGVGILFYTTDIAELVNLSHRVYVMFEGEITAELSGEELTEESILHASFGSSLPAPVDETAGT
ncbi:MAG: sugar ABC transporter ATP-binding protein [Acidimicrobiales bacterium]